MGIDIRSKTILAIFNQLGSFSNVNIKLCSRSCCIAKCYFCIRKKI